MLVEAGFEVGHPLPESGILLLELRKLLLLEREDRQQRTEELPHRQRGGGPVLGANTRIGGNSQIHRA